MTARSGVGGGCGRGYPPPAVWKIFDFKVVNGDFSCYLARVQYNFIPLSLAIRNIYIFLSM